MLFIPWLLLILLLIHDHLPGVICLTPAFWLLGPVIGLGMPQFSHSQTSTALRWEAFIAGGVWGILTGAASLISGLVAFGPDPAARNFTLLFGAGLIVFGAGGCALLAGWTAGRVVRHLGLEDDN
jgi:hypothetical protein